MSVLAIQEDRELRIQTDRLGSSSTVPQKSVPVGPQLRLRAPSIQARSQYRSVRVRMPSFLDSFIAGLGFAGGGVHCLPRNGTSPSHGENRGSSPLGSASKINKLYNRSISPGQSYGKYT